MFEGLCKLPRRCRYNPIKTTKTSFLGTMNMLGLAKRTNAKFLLSSTSEVYGDPLEHPQTEKYWGNVNPIGERSCYDEGVYCSSITLVNIQQSNLFSRSVSVGRIPVSVLCTYFYVTCCAGKRVGETLCMDYRREHDLDIKIVRIFNTYGPRMALDDGRVVSNFLAQALKNESITVYGDGSQTRSFQYVSDLVAGIVAVMSTDQGDSGPYNVGNPGEFTIMELANIVRQVANSKSEITYLENTMDDPKQRKPDITKIQTNLGWEPKMPLRRGLELMLTDFKKRLHLEDA